MAQMVKCLPKMWETLVRSVGWEDPLEKEMKTHSSILAWKMQRTEEPRRLQPMGSQKNQTKQQQQRRKKEMLLMKILK